MQRKSPLITINPVRAILKLAQVRGIAVVRSAISACGYDQSHIRHAPIARVLGSMPKPALERVLKTIQ